jgi:hypothetical protein
MGSRNSKLEPEQKQKIDELKNSIFAAFDESTRYFSEGLKECPPYVCQWCKNGFSSGPCGDSGCYPQIKTHTYCMDCGVLKLYKEIFICSGCYRRRCERCVITNLYPEQVEKMKKEEELHLKERLMTFLKVDELNYHDKKYESLLITTLYPQEIENMKKEEELRLKERLTNFMKVDDLTYSSK